MEKFVHKVEDDGAMDALEGAERPDVAAVWGQIAPSLEETTRKVRRYEVAREIRLENMRDYGVDRTEENLEFLEGVGNPQITELYKKVIEENPQLCVVKLVDEDMEGNAEFNWAMKDTTTGQVMPVMRFNFSRMETYRPKVTETWLPRKEEGDKKLGIKFMMKRLALRMGADWRRCARNRKLATGIAFLHEMGHAQDFIDNYLVPEYAMREALQPRMRMAESVAAACSRVAAVRDENLKATYVPQESQTAGQRAYREMSDEKWADEFALDYLTRHYEEYFVEDKTKGKEKALRAVRDFAEGEDRVKTEFGREMRMDADFAYVLGLTKGEAIRVEKTVAPEPEPSKYDLREGDYGIYGYEESKRYDAEGRYVRPKHARPEHYVGRHERVGGEGVIMATLQEGGAIYLNSWEGAIRVCENASGFRYVSRRGENGRVETEVYFDDERGRKFRVVRAG